jgi:uncharacterized protein
MKQRVNVITLGVTDLERARRFYEALGWTTNAADSCVEDGAGWGGITLAVNVGSHWGIAEDGGVRLPDSS